MRLLIGAGLFLALAGPVSVSRAIGDDVNTCPNANGDYAVVACSRAISLGRFHGHKLAIVYNYRAQAYYDKGDYDHAIADLNEAIRLDPKNAPAYNYQGTAYAMKGDYNRAVQDYDQAIRLHPKNFDFYLKRGQANFYSGALPAALADLNQANVLDPKDAWAALWLDIVGERYSIPLLPAAISKINMTGWPAPIIRMFRGQMTPAAVLAAANDPDAKKKKEKICVANFYSGEWTLRGGTKDEAARLFRLAAVDCPKYLFEGIEAHTELKVLGVAP